MECKFMGVLSGYDLYYSKEMKSPMGMSLLNGKPILLYEDRINQFPKRLKEVILEHEIGHITNGHFDFRSRSIDQEFEVDAYAASQLGVGQVIDAL